jgi:hypothetical protein
MYEKLLLMRDYLIPTWEKYVANREKEPKYIEIALECLKRITNEQYLDELCEKRAEATKYKFNDKVKNDFNDNEDKIIEQSMDILFDILKNIQQSGGFRGKIIQKKYLHYRFLLLIYL